MHSKGEWMVSYCYMTMDMEGLLQGSSDISSNSLLNINSMTAGDFDMAPTKMSMNMQMFGAMYAISDKWTLMGMSIT